MGAPERFKISFTKGLLCGITYDTFPYRHSIRIMILFIRLGYVFRFIPHLAFYKKENQFLTLSLFLPFLLSFYLLNTWGNVFLANYAFFAGGLFLSVYMKEKQINNFILRNNEN